jgi:hypothetical protein
MKKLFTLITIGIALAITIPKAHAQVSNGVYLKSVASRSAATDTLTNAGGKTQYASITGYQDVITIQTTVTKLSGTTAGVGYLYGSLDNVNYVRISTDSLLLTNTATQVKLWNISPSTVQYYQIKWVPSGTQSTKVQTYAIYRHR